MIWKVSCVNFIFEINGVDITPYINWSGLKYGVNDLDADEAGRTLDGVMHRSRVATKIRWDVPTKQLTTTEVQMLMELIRPEWVTLRCTDLCLGERTYQAYSNNYSIETVATGVNVEGEILWGSFTFPLIEQ